MGRKGTRFGLVEGASPPLETKPGNWTLKNRLNPTKHPSPSRLDLCRTSGVGSGAELHLTKEGDRQLPQVGLLTMASYNPMPLSLPTL